jgi:hypothetical protein
VLFIIGVGAAALISGRYLTPFISTLNAIRSGELDGVQTNITELDSLIEEVRSLRSNNKPLPDDFFSAVIKRVDTMASADKRMFISLINGKSENEIISELLISKQAFNINIWNVFAAS